MVFTGFFTRQPLIEWAILSSKSETEIRTVNASTPREIGMIILGIWFQRGNENLYTECIRQTFLSQH